MTQRLSQITQQADRAVDLTVLHITTPVETEVELLRLNYYNIQWQGDHVHATRDGVDYRLGRCQ